MVQKLTNIVKIIRIVIRSFFVVLLLFIFSWSIIFHAYYLAFFSFAASLLLLPVRLQSRGPWRVRGSLLFFTGALLILTFNLSITEVNDEIRILASKSRTPNSISLFTLREKLGIYGLNLIMAASAYPVYPEASRQTLLMIFPAPENNIRIFISDFALHSKKIRDIINTFSHSLDNERTLNQVTLEKRVRWNTRTYRFGDEESRYALALNPAQMTLIASREESRWTIQVSLKVVCRYPQNSHVTLIEEPELAIEEGLFWVLQQEGWLYPYTAEWRFQFSRDAVDLSQRVDH